MKPGRLLAAVTDNKKTDWYAIPVLAHDGPEARWRQPEGLSTIKHGNAAATGLPAKQILMINADCQQLLQVAAAVPL